MRKHFWASLLALGFALWPDRLAVAAPPAEHGNPDRGSAIFAAYCASCHGDSGQGDGPMAPRLKRDFQALPTNFTLSSWQKSHSDAELLQVIRQGGKAVHKAAFMPAWAGTLDNRQTLDLMAFVREMGMPSGTGYAPASTLGLQEKLELGRVLYGLQCLACHGTRGRGDGPTTQAREGEKRPPDFTRANYYHDKTDEELSEWAQSGVYHSGLPMDANQSWWHGPLNVEELPALILYLRAFSLR